MVILGIVQGLTEYLPVSSTAHLIFTEAFLGIRRPGILLEAVLHLGTVLAAIILFRREIVLLLAGWWSTFRRADREALADYRKVAWLIIVITAMTAVIGVALDAPLERMFSSVRGTAVQLIITGIILFFARPRGSRALLGLTPTDAIAVGVAQAVAIVPGISRSGTTITAGMLLGLRAEEATRLSFLAAIPAVAGAGLFGLKDLRLGEALGYTPGQLIVGFLVSAVFGALAIRWLLDIVRRGRLIWFALYAIVAGAVIALLWRGG